LRSKIKEEVTGTSSLTGELLGGSLHIKYAGNISCLAEAHASASGTYNIT